MIGRHSALLSRDHQQICVFQTETLLRLYCFLLSPPHISRTHRYIKLCNGGLLDARYSELEQIREQLHESEWQKHILVTMHLFTPDTVSRPLGQHNRPRITIVHLPVNSPNLSRLPPGHAPPSHLVSNACGSWSLNDAACRDPSDSTYLHASVWRSMTAPCSHTIILTYPVIAPLYHPVTYRLGTEEPDSLHRTPSAYDWQSPRTEQDGS